MRTRLLGLLAAPLLAYPIMAGCLLLVDAWGGEHFLSFYLRHEQRLLWNTFWSDYLAATPAMYIVVGLGVGTFLLFRRFRSDVPVFAVVLLLAGLGWVAAIYLTSSWVGTTHAAMVVAGALVGTPVAALLRGLLPAQPGRRLG